MEKPRRHPYETVRQQELNSYQILDSASERSFDDIVAIASHICQVPIALVSLIDNERQWFKARVGLEATQTSRDVSFCGHAILGDDILEVTDTLQDKRFADNPLVLDAPSIRFYAGAPLKSPQGMALGTLCVIDREPRKLSEEQRSALRSLARIVVEQMETRKTNLGLQRMLVGLSNEKAAGSVRLEALSEFSTGLAHEINNPLAVLMGLTEVVDLKVQDKQSVERELMQMRGAIHRVASVVSDLRAFAQERTVPKTENISMEKLLKKLQSTLTPLAQSKNVALKWPDGEGSFVKGDESQLTVVFENIIKNAIEAAQRGTKQWVEIETLVERGLWVFRCTDSGPGVALHNVPRMFEPFFTTKPTGQGQGLGLSVARGIVSAHEGTINLVSNGPTVFEVRLP